METANSSTEKVESADLSDVCSMSEEGEEEAAQLRAHDSDKEAGGDMTRTYTGRFNHLVSLLRSLNLLNFFADHAVANVIQIKVREDFLSLFVCYCFCNITA